MKISSVTILLALAAVGHSSIVFDQLYNANNADSPVVSQDFESALDAYDTIAVDDFTAARPYDLTKLSFVMGFFNDNGQGSEANITGYRVSLYNHGATPAATVYGDVAHFDIMPSQATVVPGFFSSDRVVSLDLTAAAFRLEAGDYYIGVQPIMDFGDNGEFGQTVIGTLGGVPAAPNPIYTINPGLGFYGVPIKSQYYNLALRLEGTAVPEPASLTALGLGLIAAIRRRRTVKTP